MGFTHLHVASSYSLRYGVATPDALVARAVEHGMPALALTDRDGLYGAVKHALACHRAGIGGVFGADLALVGGTRVTVLATGPRGWASLVRTVSAAHLGSPRGEPAVTREAIAANAGGLVVLLGRESDVGRAVAARRPGAAAELLAGWRGTAEVAVEVVDHLGKGQLHQAARMLALARAAGVPAVLTNEVRGLRPADAPVTQVLDAARRLAPLDLRHLEAHTSQAYLKSGAEMLTVAERVCEHDRAAARALLAATGALAERCVLEPGRDLGMSGVHLPEVAGDAAAELRARCAAGLVRRRLDDDAEARDRLELELRIIEGQRLAPYFLTIADVADLIRSLGIRCAIRGSGAGSLVNHLIGISDIDPLEHGLVMERFLNRERDGLPDIDLDVESARRIEAYQAIRARYGDGRFACVSMMETYRARSAIRDVGAAMGLPPHEIDRVAKAFPHIRARQIRTALTELPELAASGLGQAQLAGLFRIAERLDGLPRHIALHPCGVLLSNLTLRDRTPVERSMLELPMSQFDKDDVEDMGLIKLDVLGVRMQSAIAHTLAEVERVEGVAVDIDAVPRDDEATYELVRTSRTLGCFQIESPGQRELVAKLLPRDLGDLIVDISLFRPGPVNSDMIGPYLDTRHHGTAPAYPHPDLAGVLRETGGVVVFHEQVLRIIDTMTGCGLDQAEKARRMLADEVGRQAVETQFREMALESGYDAETVDRVWAILAAFGAFGFCKAHAASFAIPTYQSAWLKCHHPAAFYAGVLTHEPGMYPKRAILDDARHFGVEVLPLDVNSSGAHWRVEPCPGGRYGLRVALAEVKGISEEETARAVAGRPYHSLADFWHRAGASRPVVERIVLVGGFDALYGIRPVPPGGPLRRPGRITRRDLLAQVGALARATGRSTSRTSRRRSSPGDTTTQLGLGVVEHIPAGELPEMTMADRVETELEVLGLDISRHVLSFYTPLLDALGVVRARDLPGCRAGADVLVAGVKVATQTPAVRSGQRIIFTTLDDATGLVDLTFFESVQARCAATVFGSWLLVARGRVRRAGGRAVTLNAVTAVDLVQLEGVWRAGGLRAARALIQQASRPAGAAAPTSRIVYANGYRLSPYADIGPAGGAVGTAPRRLWHASQGSSGGWIPADQS